jgi:hypothetical protein
MVKTLASDKSSFLLIPTINRLGLFALVIFALNWFLKPDLFGLVPNSLDPMFYTGYAINLDDALASAGNEHYFVTRWTSYYPMYLFSEVFGAYLGRLIWRLVLVLWISEALWRMGFHLYLRPTARLCGIVVVITSPFFLRAFTTDYPEYFTMSIGLIFFIYIIQHHISLRMAVFLGITTSSLLIANPFTAGLIITGLAIFIIRNWHLLFTKAALISVFVYLMSFVGVFYFGYLLFKLRYGIGNIYQPTIDFLRNYQAPEFDPARGSNHDWVFHFTWIYIAPVLIIVAIVLKRNALDKQRQAIFFLGLGTTVIFLYHVILELRRGHALETSFYWSMSLPVVLAFLFVLIGMIADLTESTATISATFFLVLLLFFSVPEPLRYGAGWAMYFGIAATVLIVVLSLHWEIKMSIFITTFMVTWMQIGAPIYSNQTNAGGSNSPYYDEMYRKRTLVSDLVYRETIWFEKTLDQLSNEGRTTFLSAGGWSASIVGIYIPHPFDRVVYELSTEQLLSLRKRIELEVQHRPSLTVYGDKQLVSNYLTRLRMELPFHEIVLDQTYDSELGYRVVVLKKMSTKDAMIVISPNEMNTQIGQVKEDGTLGVDTQFGEKLSGYLTFGPYVGLTPGDYTLQLYYSTAEVDIRGHFEAYSPVVKVVGRVPLTVTSKEIQVIQVKFSVTGNEGPWEFRTYVESASDLSISKIVLTRK